MVPPCRRVWCARVGSSRTAQEPATVRCVLRGATSRSRRSRRTTSLSPTASRVQPANSPMPLELILSRAARTVPKVSTHFPPPRPPVTIAYLVRTPPPPVPRLLAPPVGLASTRPLPRPPRPTTASPVFRGQQVLNTAGLLPASNARPDRLPRLQATPRAPTVSPALSPLAVP